ncbi:neprilysin-1-like isoform X4 [Dermacentor albipictus]|uniref:neprilysin-1-like isoform X4 n=1 Tax=Dermacentor albipictus TaxID=60249 RepID=UPI0038FCEC27
MDVRVRQSSNASGRNTCAKACVLTSSVVIGVIGVCAVLLMAYRDSRFLLRPRHSKPKMDRGATSQSFLNNSTQESVVAAGTKDGRGVSIADNSNCTNQLCLPEASYLVSRLNLSVGQCDDFYRFVCSDRWFTHESQELPFRFSSVQHVYDTLQRYAKDGLLNLVNIEKLDASSALVKTLVFVENCTSSATRLQSEPEHFEAVMRRFGLGLFPYTSRPLRSSNVHFVLATMARELGLFPIFAVAVLPASKRKKRHHTILLKQRLRRWHEADLLSTDTYHWVLKRSASLLPSIQHLTLQQYQEVLKFSKEVLMMASYRPPVPEHALVNAAEFAMYEKINLTSFLATLFEQSHVYTKESSIAVNSKAYFHRLFTYLDTGVEESTVLNYLGVYLWVHLSPLFPDEHSNEPHLPGVPYGMPGGSKRFPLCLRYAETLCPQGMFALLTVAMGQTNSSVEFVRPLEWWIGDLKDVLFNFTKRLTWQDEETVEKLLAKVEKMHISFVIPGSLLHEPNVFKWTCESYDVKFAALPPILHFVEAKATVLRSHWNHVHTGISLLRHMQSFDYKIRYSHDTNTLSVPASYFGEVLKAPPVLRRFYAVKILPDALEEVLKLLLKQGSYSLKNFTVFSSWTENATLRFDALEDCLMKAYIDKLLVPLNYTVLKSNFPWVLAELVGARLALDLYVELYKKISAKATPNDSGIFVRGFSPFRADQMAFIFYAENTCEPLPTQNATHRFLTHGISPRDKTRVSLASLQDFTASFRCLGGMAMRSAVPPTCRPWRNG